MREDISNLEAALTIITLQKDAEAKIVTETIKIVTKTIKIITEKMMGIRWLRNLKL